MAKWLVAASFAWPALLAAAAWHRATGDVTSWAAVVYFAASRICHQIPERSFHVSNVPWPVCARCSGLYLAAPVGALVATWSPIRRLPEHRLRWWLAVASLPTAATWIIERLGVAPVSNDARFIAALPLGAVIAVAIVRVASGRAGTIR